MLFRLTNLTYSYAMLCQDWRAMNAAEAKSIKHAPVSTQHVARRRTEPDTATVRIKEIFLAFNVRLLYIC